MRFASLPAAKVAGSAKPVTLTPAPEKVIPEIVTLPVPVLANCTVFVTSLPTATLPKAIEDGDTLRMDVAAAVPVPLRATAMLGSEALLVIVIVPVSAALEVGLKRTLIVVF